MLATLAPTVARAASTSNYEIFPNGDVVELNPSITAYGNSDAFVYLLPQSNSVEFSLGGGPAQPLNTNLFTVSSITDVTYTDGHVANVEAAGGNYEIFPNGDVVELNPSITAYGNSDAFVYLMPQSNSVEFSLGGGPAQPLNTNLFTVSSITDVTYTDGHVANVEAAGGNYEIFPNGDVVELNPSITAYGNSDAFVYLLPQSNSVEFSLGGGPAQPLNTNLFTVSSITDVTYTDGHVANVTVTEPASVPEPRSLAVLSVGLAGLAVAWRPKRNAAQKAN